MSQDEVHNLKKMIVHLEDQLQLKSSEVLTYRQELIKMSHKLDELMSQVAFDVEVLSRLQKIIVPTEVPQLPGFEISRKFVYGTKSGGDYFDFFENKDKLQFGILIAASSGYAMSALFLSLILKISHMVESKKGKTPDLILQGLAEEIKSLALSAPRSQQATASSSVDMTHAFYGLIDRRKYSMSFCMAGQIYGFYLTPNKNLQILKSSSAPLSQNFSEKLTLAELDLEPKSRLCLITYGLYDVLGIDQVAQIILDTSKQDVHGLRNELLFQAQKKSGLDMPTRDQTVVVIDVKDRVIKLAK